MVVDKYHHIRGNIIMKKNIKMKRKSTLISTPLKTERMPDGRRKLLRELALLVEGKEYPIEKGYVTDYSSIPWFGRFVVRWSRVDIAGVIHDWLYEKGSGSRSEADRIWKIVAQSGEHHASCLQAGICWFALRVGACCAWKRHKDSRKKHSMREKDNK